MQGLWRAIKAYADHPDPRVAAANLVALVVVGNQPFYPLYVRWVVGPDYEPAFWTFLSTPFFLAVPALARRNSLAGRALLPLVGIGNTLLSVWAFGQGSGVALFLLPCLLLAFVLFRPAERLASFAVAGLAFAVYAVPNQLGDAPYHRYADAEYASFLAMNAVSVGMLTALIGMIASRIMAEGDDGR